MPTLDELRKKLQIKSSTENSKNLEKEEIDRWDDRNSVDDFSELRIGTPVLVAIESEIGHEKGKIEFVAWDYTVVRFEDSEISLITDLDCIRFDLPINPVLETL